MRALPLLALAVVLAAPAARARAADVTPLFPDRAWLVLGVDVKTARQSPLGKKVFGMDGPVAAVRKLLAAFGNQEDADRLKALAPLDPVLDRVTRLTAVTSEGGEPPGSDDFRAFLEADIDDAALARAIESACQRQKLPYKAEAVGGRTLHVAGDERLTLRVFRLDKETLAVVFTAAAVTDVLDLQAGKKKSKAPKAVVEGVRAINPAATPMWQVVGENRVDDRVEYSRMVATAAVAADVTLRIRMEAPDAAATGRCRETLQLFVTLFSSIKDNRLLKELGDSAKVEARGTAVTVTTVLSGTALADEYAKQK